MYIIYLKLIKILNYNKCNLKTIFGKLSIIIVSVNYFCDKFVKLLIDFLNRNTI